MIAMKRCFKCKKVKPLGKFYAHPMMSDGHLNKCIDCAKADVAARVVEKSKDPDWLAAERERHRLKQANYRKLGVATPVSKEARKRWAKRNPHKIKAQRQAHQAVRSGKIKRKKKCEGCGKQKRLQMHHDDYSKPLDVQFLCSGCHGKAHHK